MGEGDFLISGGGRTGLADPATAVPMFGFTGSSYSIHRTLISTKYLTDTGMFCEPIEEHGSSMVCWDKWLKIMHTLACHLPDR